MHLSNDTLKPPSNHLLTRHNQNHIENDNIHLNWK